MPRGRLRCAVAQLLSVDRAMGGARRWSSITACGQASARGCLERHRAALQLDFLKKARDSPYWTQYIPKKQGAGELLRYTDRYQPDRRGASSTVSFLQLAPLQKEVFPPHLWDSFTSSESKRAAKRTAQMQNRTAKIDWDHLHMEEKRAGDGEEEAPPESDEEDLGEYEDEVDDDYAQNYFDNGEDDDDMDADGGDEAAFD